MRKKLAMRFVAFILTMIMIISPYTNINAATTCWASPYAQIEYGYSASVTPGTIRYIYQNIYSGYFKSSYWGSWQSQANIECGTSCISMALSYVGINKTPQTILDKHNGITYFDGWGVTYLCPSFSTAISNYINGNGKYSPPIIYLDNYSDAGHFVVVVGQKSSTVCSILDPYNDSIWDMTINGSVATYIKGGASKTDTISDVRQYYNSSIILDSEAPKISNVQVTDV